MWQIHWRGCMLTCLWADVAVWSAYIGLTWHAYMVAEDLGACNTDTEELAAPRARESHTQELPSMCGGACRARWWHAWWGSNSCRQIYKMD